MYVVLWACHSPTVQVKVEGHNNYETAKLATDFIGLLNIVEGICHTGAFGKRTPSTVKTVLTENKLLSMGQKQNKSASEFAKRIQLATKQYVDMNGHMGLFRENIFIELLNDVGLDLEKYAAMSNDRDVIKNKEDVEKAYAEKFVLTVLLKNTREQGPYDRILDD